MPTICRQCEMKEGRCKCLKPDFYYEELPIEVPETLSEANERIDKDFTGDDKIDKVADLLIKDHNFLTLKGSEEILIFNGKIYSNKDATAIIKTKTEKLIPNCSSHDRNEVINKIKAKTFTDLEDFDKEPHFLTIDNGILDILTLELLPHTPKHLSKVLLPVSFTAPATTTIETELADTEFLKFLKGSFTVNGKFRKADFDTVLEITASFLIKSHIDQKAFMFLGSGDNGKGVLLNYIIAMLGKPNISAISLQKLASNQFAAANLAFKIANIFPDLEKNELKLSGTLKAIIANEPVEVEIKYKQAFTMYPFCKLLFSANRFPKALDTSQGFFRRWIIVKWERSFENDSERIEFLREKLENNKQEINKVFSSLVLLAGNLYQQAKFTNSKTWKQVRDEWNANADPAGSYIETNLEVATSDLTKLEVHTKYKHAMADIGELPLGIAAFGRIMKEHYDDNTGRFDGVHKMWVNVAFKEPKQTTLNDNDTTKV